VIAHCACSGYHSVLLIGEIAVIVKIFVLVDGHTVSFQCGLVAFTGVCAGVADHYAFDIYFSFSVWQLVLL